MSDPRAAGASEAATADAPVTVVAVHGNGVLRLGCVRLAGAERGKAEHQAAAGRQWAQLKGKNRGHGGDAIRQPEVLTSVCDEQGNLGLLLRIRKPAPPCYHQYFRT